MPETTTTTTTVDPTKRGEVTVDTTASAHVLGTDEETQTERFDSVRDDARKSHQHDNS